MGVGKVQASPALAPQYYLFEFTPARWVRYEDYTNPVPLPKYLTDARRGFVTPLAHGTAVYDYTAQHGNKLIGVWVDHAARRAGR